jgi:hypothetical protein
LKPFFPAVAALAIGIVLGAWQPRGELLSLRAEMDALRADRARPCRAGAASSIRQLLRADAGTLGQTAGGQQEDEPAPAPAEGGDTDVPADDGPVATAPDEPAPPAQSPEELRAALHTALDARRAQALAALVEQGDLDDDAVAGVNAAADQMNQELKSEIDRFVDDANQAGEVDRRDVMDFAAGALDIVIAADDRMRKVVPEEAYADIDDSAVDPFSYVSGDTLDALERLKDMPSPMFE